MLLSGAVPDGGGRGRGLRVRRGSRSRPGARAVRVASSDAAPRAARGAAAARPGVRRLAADPAAADDDLRRASPAPPTPMCTRGCRRCGCSSAPRCWAPRSRCGRRCTADGCRRSPPRPALYLVVSIGGTRLRRRSSSASSSRRTSRCERRRSSSTTSRRRARRSASTASPSGRCPAKRSLTRADLERNAATIDNVPLWNDRPLLDTFSQIQEIRTYYDFVAVDNDRYTDQRQYRQIMLSARELNSRSLPSRTWINEHLTFTHGYGLTLGPGERGDARRPAGPVHQGPAAGLDGRPQGDAAGDLLTASCRTTTSSSRRKTEEFDYPRGDDNVFADYKGERRRAAVERLPPPDVRDPLPLDRHVLLAEPDAREPRDDVPPTSPSAWSGSRRSSATIPIPTSRSPTARWSGCRTSTRRRGAIRTPRPRAA